MRPELSDRIVAAAATLLILSGCIGSAPDGPSFYRNLSASGARFDAIAARDMINALRAREGLPAVGIHPALATVAKTEATEVARRATPSGRVSPSPDLDRKVAAAGYPLGAMRQNVSAGYYTIAEAFSGWRESDRHRRTMLMADATDMGIAAVNAPRAKYKVYWTLIMANRKP